MFDHLLRGPKKDEHLALEETPDGAHVAWTGRDRATPPESWYDSRVA